MDGAMVWELEGPGPKRKSLESDFIRWLYCNRFQSLLYALCFLKPPYGDKILPMKTFILLSALPGAGKSTWANAYKKEHPEARIVTSDGIRTELFGRPDVFVNEPLVWKMYGERMNQGVDEDKNLTVIADATHLTNALRMQYYNLTPKFDKHILVLFDIPYEVCLAQNNGRETRQIVPLKVMEKFKKEYEEPSDEVLASFDEIIRVQETKKSA